MEMLKSEVSSDTHLVNRDIASVLGFVPSALAAVPEPVLADWWRTSRREWIESPLPTGFLAALLLRACRADPVCVGRIMAACVLQAEGWSGESVHEWIVAPSAEPEDFGHAVSVALLQEPGAFPWTTDACRAALFRLASEVIDGGPRVSEAVRALERCLGREVCDRLLGFAHWSAGSRWWFAVHARLPWDADHEARKRLDPLFSVAPKLAATLGRGVAVAVGTQPSPERLTRAMRNAEVLARVSADLASTLTTGPEFVQYVAEEVAVALDDCCALLLPSPDGAELVPIGFAHRTPELTESLRQVLASSPVRPGEGISGRTFSTGTPVVLPQIDPALMHRLTKPEYHDFLDEHPVHGIISVPLRVRERVLGVMTIVRDVPDRSFDDLEVHHIQSLADLASLAIANAQLREERERTQAALLQRTAELETAVAELESFAYTVAHDIRAPLRAMGGFAEIILDEHAPGLDEDGRAMLKRVKRNTEHLSQLVDDLLLLSRIARGKIELKDIDLATIAREAAADILLRVPDRRVDLVIGQALATRGDPSLAAILLANLLDNAIKFTGKTPTARIEVGRGDDGVFFVRDNGAGFDMAHLARMFQPFERLHGQREFPGSGIGLATVARIIRRHGGSIRAEGAIGEGATLYFTLTPVTEEFADGACAADPAGRGQ